MTVLTTNFDTILQDVCKANKRLHHLEVIQTTSDYTKLSTSPPYPQLIYLHGSVEHYTDKNTITEINEELHPDLVSKVLTALKRPSVDCHRLSRGGTFYHETSPYR